MGVSKNLGLPNHHVDRVFHYKPSILMYHYFWKHPYIYIYIRHLPINIWGVSPKVFSQCNSTLHTFPCLDRGLIKNTNIENLKQGTKIEFSMDRALRCARFFLDFMAEFSMDRALRSARFSWALWQGNVDMLAACMMQSLIILV